MWANTWIAIIGSQIRKLKMCMTRSRPAWAGAIIRRAIPFNKLVTGFSTKALIHRASFSLRPTIVEDPRPVHAPCSPASHPSLARLTPSTLHRVLAPVPSAPPLEDVAAALGPHPGELFSVAAALEPARGERLLRLSQRPLPDTERWAAGERLVRGLFWTLVYELEPERWVALAEAEPISPQLLRDLPAAGARVVEVGAGAVEEGVQGES